LRAQILSIFVSDGVVLRLIPHVLGEELNDGLLATVRGAEEEERSISQKGELTYVVVFVRLLMIDSNDMRLGDDNFFIEFVALLVLHIL
jgi:hypothetical protein